MIKIKETNEQDGEGEGSVLVHTADAGKRQFHYSGTLAAAPTVYLLEAWAMNTNTLIVVDCPIRVAVRTLDKHCFDEIQYNRNQQILKKG